MTHRSPLKRSRWIALLGLALIALAVHPTFAQLVVNRPQELAAAPAPAYTETLSWPLSNSDFEDGFVDTFPNAWMYHALRWKAKKTGAQYSPSDANLPFDHVYDYYAATVDLREDDNYYPCVFPQPGNPSGGWVAGESVWRDYDVFVWFALSTQCHQSPLYVNIRQGVHHPIVVREMTAQVTGWPTIQDMCANWWSCEDDPTGWIHQCTARASDYVDVTSMTYDVWKSGWTPNQTLSGQDLWQAFSDRQIGWRDLVYDPTEETYAQWIAHDLLAKPTLPINRAQRACQPTAL